MKFDCGISLSEKAELKKNWHLWFAWYPVRCSDGLCHWLENIERKGTFWMSTSAWGWDWEYRPLGEQNE